MNDLIDMNKPTFSRDEVYYLLDRERRRTRIRLARMMFQGAVVGAVVGQFFVAVFR